MTSVKWGKDFGRNVELEVSPGGEEGLLGPEIKESEGSGMLDLVRESVLLL